MALPQGALAGRLTGLGADLVYLGLPVHPVLVGASCRLVQILLRLEDVADGMQLLLQQGAVDALGVELLQSSQAHGIAELVKRGILLDEVTVLGQIPDRPDVGLGLLLDGQALLLGQPRIPLICLVAMFYDLDSHAVEERDVLLLGGRR